MMRNPTLHDKLLDLYIKREEPDAGNIKRAIESYLRKRYPENKIENVRDSLMKSFDFVKEAAAVRCRNHLSSYIDSIIVSRIRDTYRSSLLLDLDELDEKEFKAVVKQVLPHFGYNILFVPAGSSDSLDMIVHRKDIKIAVFAMKCAPEYAVGIKPVQQAKYIADHYNCERIILVSSTTFDAEAVDEAIQSGITLLNRERLLPLIRDLIENRQKEEKELLFTESDSSSNTLFLEGEIKFPKAKVQVAFIRYLTDSREEQLIFEGEVLNNGKMPAVNISVEIKVFNRSGECLFHKITPIEQEKLQSKEKVNFRVVFDHVLQANWRNLCRYELRLDYSNVHISNHSTN